LESFARQIATGMVNCLQYYPRADGAKRRARVLIPPANTPGETKALAKSKVHQ
jgi:hypothetical protein